MYKLIDILTNNSECKSCGRPKRLFEAYSEKAITGFIKRFLEQAEDLNLDVSEEELRKYIKIFDKIKEKLPIDRRDLANYKVPELIRVVTKGKTEDDKEEGEEITPDVVYHNDDNSIIIYNGNTEGTCIKYGKDEKWCISQSSWSGHRYSEVRGYPTFYLAKNTNLPKSNKLSFVVIAVRDPKVFGNENYVLHPRDNSPHYPDPITFEELLNEAPWLREVPNLKSIIKYVPLSSQEKMVHKYKTNTVNYREWTGFPYKDKESYLVARKNARDDRPGIQSKLFSDISDDEFVRDRLSKFPDVLRFVVRTPDLVEPELLLKNLNNFSDEARKSVTSNLHTPIETKLLASDSIPFGVKKILVKLKKWELDPNQRLYVTADGDTIVKLTLGDDVKIGLYQAEDEYPDIKLNKRTSKYLLDYPGLDEIPFVSLVKLSEKGIIDFNVIQKVLDNVKDKPNSPIMVKDTEDGKIIIDATSLTAYKVKGSEMKQVPFTDEEVQSAFKDAISSDEFKKNALQVFSSVNSSEDLPKSTNLGALINIINSLPYDQRTMNLTSTSGEGSKEVVAFADFASGEPLIYFMEKTPESVSSYFIPVRKYAGRANNGGSRIETAQYDKYFNYLRQTNQFIDDEKLKGILNYSLNSREKRNFLNSYPPLDPNNVLKPVIDSNGEIFLLNTVNRRNSFRLSPRTGNVVGAILSQGRYNQLLRLITPTEPDTQTAPQQTTTAQQQGQQAARTYYQQPAPVGDVNIVQMMQGLGAEGQFLRIPNNDRRRLNITNGARLNQRVDGGARRRNQLLGNAGQVEAAYAALTSRIYVIRLANGTRVISIKVYPGNREYLLIPGQRVYSLDEPNQLLALLRQNNLAEARKYFIRSYLDINPGNLEEIKEIIRQHSNK